jgi:3'-phosphoadenosine 5'-phosphosulfate sulfotransferase (PAPS reductase)/FAD synthetase
MFPSGAAQYCTGNLKVKPFNKFLESRSYEPISCVGIRREESVRRRDYKEWEYNDGFDVWVWRPIIDWTEQDVIDCHKRWNVKPNPLYLEGSHRVGCFPCIRSNKKELSEFPMEHKHIHVLRILEEYHSTRREKEVSFFRQGNIDSVLDWSRTQHGGKQYMLFNSNTPTCEKWGMCGI